MSGTVATLLLLLAAAAGAQAAQAREPVERTGSRLGADTTKRTIVRLAEPAEIDRVLRLLEQNRTDEAIALAEDYLKSLDSASLVGGSPPLGERYSGLNALCVAFTKAGRIDEAIAACSEAIAISPTRWTALNSRGTAYFAARDFDRALADYRTALDVAPRRGSVVMTIEHNIRLAEQRLTAQRP
jgi:Flp pilus assembly protein TadD